MMGSTEVGWIGAMSFSPAAWSVKVRDERLGWEEEGMKGSRV